MRKPLFILMMILPFTVFSQINILPLGESTTDVGPVYRRKLCELLTADATNYDMVGPKDDGATTYDGDHAGYSGSPCDAVQANMVSFANTIDADIILIWEGTNNCGWASVGGTITPLSTLVDKCCQLYPNALVFVGSIPPMSYNAYESVEHNRLAGVAAANGILFNDAMPAMCSTKVAQSKKVIFVDARSLVLATDVSSDGIHPTQAGYDKMGTFFYNAIKSTLTVTSVSLPTTKELAIGATTTLTALCLPADVVQAVTWSSNDALATVSSRGVVTGVSIGTAIITATSKIDPSKTATCTVTVSPAVSSVVLPTKASLVIGSTTTLAASVLPSNAVQTVTWLSNNPAVSADPTTGVLTGVSLGTSVITATSIVNSTKKVYCTVTVTATSNLSTIEKSECSIFPNPITNKQATIIFSNPFSGQAFLCLYDVLGNILFSTETSSVSTVTINLPESLAKGLYLLKIESETSCIIKPIIIE